LVKGYNDQFLSGLVAVERILYMHNKDGELSCKFSVIEGKSDKMLPPNVNIVEDVRVVISIPTRNVLVPLDNIGLMEETAFPCLESTNSLGTDINLNADVILNKIPSLGAYYSESTGKFHPNPCLLQKELKQEAKIVRFPHGDTKSAEVSEQTNEPGKE